MKLLPSNDVFFDQLEQLAGHVVTSADTLRDLAKAVPKVGDQVKQIEQEEKSARELAQSSLEKLDKAFITPIDREDILALTGDLAGIVDTISGLAQRMTLYKIQSLDPEFIQQTETLSRMGVVLNDVIHKLRDGHKLSDVADKLLELHTLENGADEQRRAFLGKLFEGTPDPLDVMKRKELQDLVERATDECDAVSKTLQRAILKNS